MTEDLIGRYEILKANVLAMDTKPGDLYRLLSRQEHDAELTRIGNIITELESMNDMPEPYRDAIERTLRTAYWCRQFLELTRSEHEPWTDSTQ